MKKSKILVLGMLGTIFFRAARLRAVPAFRPSLLLSKGFALLPCKNGVEIAAVEGGAASIDRHGVTNGQEWPCRDPGTGGRILAPRKKRQKLKKTDILMKITVFCSKSIFLTGRAGRVRHALHHQI